MKEIVYIVSCPPFWVKTPPLSLIYLKTYLEKKGIKAGILDLNIILFRLSSFSLKEWLTLNVTFEKNLFSHIENKYSYLLENTYKKIKDTEFIGFSLFERNSPFAFSLAKKIKEKYPDKKMIFGGPHTLFLEKKGLINSKDYWVIGEGEMPLFNILNNGRKKIYRFREVENLDTLPFYDFSSLTAKLYSKTLPLLSSRGCPHKCRFCSERFLYKKFRHHSPGYMVGQIYYLQREYHTNNFIFCDSLINYKQAWLKEFCSLVIKNKLNIKWEAQMRIEYNFPLDLAKLLKKSGCYNLFIGLESGSDKMLGLMNKGFTSACASNFFKILHKANLHFETSLIFGYPGEEKKEFKETLNFIIKNKKNIPKIAQVNAFVDYLGNFPNKMFSGHQAKERTQLFLKVLEKEKIRYTKSFINNLIY